MPHSTGQAGCFLQTAGCITQLFGFVWLVVDFMEWATGAAATYPMTGVYLVIAGFTASIVGYLFKSRRSRRR